MGYTHYWHRAVGSEISREAWAAICADATVLVAASPCELLFEYDEPGTKPLIDDILIRFNGAGDEGHEDFLFERVAPEQWDYERGNPSVFAFCKTAHKPYDHVVCGVLASIKKHAPSVDITSDGDLEDWRGALDWASKVLGRDVASPCEED
jgi:hypothetical protein